MGDFPSLLEKMSGGGAEVGRGVEVGTGAGGFASLLLETMVFAWAAHLLYARQTKDCIAYFALRCWTRSKDNPSANALPDIAHPAQIITVKTSFKAASTSLPKKGTACVM